MHGFEERVQTATALVASLALLTGCAGGARTGSATTVSTLVLARKKDTLNRAPDIESPSVRVRTLLRSKESRTNMVEMRGRLALHTHPDARHGLMVLKGRVRLFAGGKHIELGPGDFISIPAGLPHGYDLVNKGVPALLVSSDGPAYDPAKTVSLEEREEVRRSLSPPRGGSQTARSRSLARATVKSTGIEAPYRLRSFLGPLPISTTC